MSARPSLLAGRIRRLERMQDRPRLLDGCPVRVEGLPPDDLLLLKLLRAVAVVGAGNDDLLHELTNALHEWANAKGLPDA
jgi:hypothetical protein